MNTGPTFERITTSSAQSFDLAAALAKHLQPPCVLELVGDLGGGKTTFVKGLAHGLGISQTVTSPTFTIHRRYQASHGITLEHYDLYRLDEDRVVLAELAERAADPQALTAVEWGQNFEAYLPADRLKISFHFIDEATRRLEFTATGPQAAQVLNGLKGAADDLGLTHR